jgi:SAM-dependent methyltransferase
MTSNGTNESESAVARHDRMVQEERLQAERVRTDRPQSPDMWQPRAEQFRPSEDVEDPAVDVLASFLDPNARVIDVGAGGGRLALPLARRCREVVAVEPSPSMRAVLEDAARQLGVTNLRIVPATWEEAEVEPAELVFAANVTYGIQVIESFLRKLDRMATRRAALVSVVDPPQIELYPFWPLVYGEERLRLPCRDELLDVLRELGASPEVIPLPAFPPRSFGPAQRAYETLRARLFIGPGSPAESRLRPAIEALTVERDGELWLRDARPRERAVIHWRPGSMR